MKASKFFLSSIVSLVMILGFSMQAHAQLELLGQGTSTHGTWNFIYDTDLDITWYDYAVLKYDGHDIDNWQLTVNWADELSVTFGGNVYDDWRLPTAVDGPDVSGYDGTTTSGYNITSSEVGHLFYTELGNEGSLDTSGNPTGCGESDQQPDCLTNTGDFQNLQAVNYWSGTEHSFWPYGAWDFDMLAGNQGVHNKISGLYAIAVRSGRAVVPEPISSTLFIVGGATLGFRRFRKKFKK